MDRRNRSSLGRLRHAFFIRSLFMYFAMMVIPVFIVGILSIYTVRKHVYRQIKDTTETVFSISSKAIEPIISDTRRISIFIDSHSDLLLSLVSLFSGDEHDGAIEDNGYFGFIDEILAYSPNIQYVMISKPGSRNVVINSMIMESSQSLVSDTGRSINDGASIAITGAKMRMSDFDSKEIDSIAFSIPLKYGMMLSVFVKQSYIRQLLDDVMQYEGEIVMILDSDGNVISSNSQAYDRAYIDSLDQSRYIIQSHGILTGGEVLVSMIPKSVTMGASDAIISFTLIASAIAGIASLVISLVLSRSLYKRIDSILSIFEQNDAIDEQLMQKSMFLFDTYNYILEGVAKSYVRETSLREKVVEGERDLAVTKLMALQYQLNPHFIFNTLQSIDLAVKDRSRKEDASRMIGNFSRILRYSLQDPSRLVMLDEEIAATRDYIALQGIRFKDRVMVIWDYDEEEIQRVRCIRMLFQPMIENIYQHGIRSDGAPTLVRIAIEKRDGSLSIDVSDNGPGTDSRMLSTIVSSINQKTPPEHHIGLYNVNQRLSILFGEECMLHLSSVQGSGFSISLSIPLDRIGM